MSALDDSLETALRRDRLIVIVALTAVAFLAWSWLLSGSGMGMGGTGMPAKMDSGGMAPQAWDGTYAALMFSMWWIMILAMMLPSAAPMILLFAAISRRQRQRGGLYAPTSAFAAGYVLAWAGFSAVAVALQWALQHVALLSEMMVGTSRILGGLVLVAAGLYQLTRLKHACLQHCRSPAYFLSQHWRTGSFGAMRMGLEHGAFCVGCCWFLMFLLFVGGVMNLAWIAGLALFVLAEKTAPAGTWLARAAGVALMVSGGWLLLDMLYIGEHPM
jgi:predicted metal-binding membrane protein